VLAILGIAAAAVAPALSNAVTVDPLHAAGDDVLRILAGARTVALAEGSMVTVIVQTPDGRYRVEAGRGVEVRELATGRLDLPQDVRVTGGVADAARVRIRFRPLGGADGGPVVLYGPTGALRIEVDPWTGETSVAGR